MNNFCNASVFSGGRQRRMRTVAALYPVAKGSLREVRRNCLRPGCATCASGRMHTAWLMTFYLDGR